MTSCPQWLTGFLDDASSTPYDASSAAVGSRVVTDTDLPSLRKYAGPVRVVVSGGAGQVVGPAVLGARLGLELVAVEVALRDLDDLAGNARRVVAVVDAARAGGALTDDVVIHLALPAGPPSYGSLGAADEAAAANLALTLVAGDPAVDPSLEQWVDAALDRELPFSLRGGTISDAMEALTTTARLWSGEDPSPDALVRARRWCRSWTCPDVAAALATLELPGVSTP